MSARALIAITSICLAPAACGGTVEEGTDADGWDTIEDASPDTAGDPAADAVDPIDDPIGDTPTDGPSSPVLLLSEYVEGSGDSKAVEIHNAGSSGCDLGPCDVRIYFSGDSTAGIIIPLDSTTLDAGGVHVLCHTGFTSPGAPPCDQMSDNVLFSGDDAVDLACGGTVLDVIGQIGLDPGAQWGEGLVSTEDNTLRRKCAVTSGDTNGSDAFDPSVEWDGFAIDTMTGLGVHCP